MYLKKYWPTLKSFFMRFIQQDRFVDSNVRGVQCRVYSIVIEFFLQLRLHTRHNPNIHKRLTNASLSVDCEAGHYVC